MVACPPESDLRGRTARTLSPAEADDLARHLESCERCSRMVDECQTLAPPDWGTLNPPDAPKLQELIDRVKALRRAPEPHSEPLFSPVGPRSASFPPAARALLEPALEPGELGRLGHYRVLKLLGTGGMGVVFDAEDTLLGRPVALKVILPRAARDPDAQQRFVREARAAAAVEHPNVVAVYQVGTAGGTAYIAMQRLQGRTLHDYLATGKRLSPARAARVARDAAEGLAAAHAKGVVHRDVKPANLWLEAPGGRTKVLDFGLARPADEPGLTVGPVVLGTPGYMAPEQAGGAPADARADLFALGCVLYQTLTGRSPASVRPARTGLTADTATLPAVRSVNPAVPEELEELTHQLLAADPAARPASAAEVAGRLTAIERRLRRGSPSRAADSGAVAAPPRRRRRWVWAVGAALAAVAAAVVGGYLPPPPPNHGVVHLEPSPFGAVMVTLERDGRVVETLRGGRGDWHYVPEGTYHAKAVGPTGELGVTSDQGGAEVTVRTGGGVRLWLYPPNAAAPAEPGSW